MGGFLSTKFAFGTFVVIAVMEATYPAFAQNINDVLLTLLNEGQHAKVLQLPAAAVGSKAPQQAVNV
jgi:hypothetical protein